jgi:hypothetical protein
MGFYLPHNLSLSGVEWLAKTKINYKYIQTQTPNTNKTIGERERER